MNAPDRIRLRLYVAGPSPRSARTIDHVRRLCEGALAEACDLEIVDLYQQPGLAAEDGVVAAPTLLRLSPLPVRRVAGDLTDARRVLATLGLDAGGASPPQAAQQQQQQGTGGGDVA
ncbi:circadian clock protein KaiB [Methylobacterium sp. Leaf456]|uniref:circadian clock KaiB family protein n=1 Tax=Methylobacterium sp. Leaf456 TaxID=1736382 RepID=UPI000700335C|nr:circadian clock KaiB family protein [Methylobacterium sp. Leaf456]KQT61541.1 circadian clock protein KaiB [Methylobacterium sp. Leaf456]